MTKNRVVLFYKYAFHKSCLDPIAKELDLLEIPYWKTGKRHLVYDEFDKSKKQFDIFVISDEWASLFRKVSKILITTGHSMVSKNTTFNSRNKEMDFIFCPSSFYKSEFLRRKVVPKRDIIVTGYPAASRIFRNEFLKNSIWFREFCTDKLKILFAPTYNRDLSILDYLIKCEAKYQFFKTFEDFFIVFKLHPVLHKKYSQHADFIKYLSLKYPNIHYYEDSHDDITDAILWSDAVVGDCSGALLLALAGNKPIFAFDNPNRFKNPYFDPEGPEWIFRDQYSYQISEENLCELSKMLSHFINEDTKKNSREELVKLLYEHRTDSEKVIANEIVNLLPSEG